MEQESTATMESQSASMTGDTQAVSLGDWMLTLFLMFLPLVNIIMLFVWAFSNGTPESKANWAKASLIWMAIGIVLYVLLFAIIGASFMGTMQ
jgi:hypothetical protein